MRERRAAGNIQSQTTEVGFCFRIEPLAIDKFQRSSPDRLASEKNVLPDVQVVKYIEFLVDESNASPNGIRNRTDYHLLTIDLQAPGVRLIDTAENFHESGFTGAIFTGQRDDLTRIDLQLDLVERNHARETFAHPPHC